MCLPYAKKNWSVVARYFSLYHLFLYLYRQLLKPDKFESNTEFLMQSSSHSGELIQWTLRILCPHSSSWLGDFVVKFFCKHIFKKLDILLKKTQAKTNLLYSLVCTVPIFSAFELPWFFSFKFSSFCHLTFCNDWFCVSNLGTIQWFIYTQISGLRPMSKMNTFSWCAISNISKWCWLICETREQSRSYAQDFKLSCEMKSIRNEEVCLDEPIRNPPFSLEMKRKR